MKTMNPHLLCAGVGVNSFSVSDFHVAVESIFKRIVIMEISEVNP